MLTRLQRPLAKMDRMKAADASARTVLLPRDSTLLYFPILFDISFRGQMFIIVHVVCAPATERTLTTAERYRRIP